MSKLNKLSGIANDIAHSIASCVNSEYLDYIKTVSKEKDASLKIGQKPFSELPAR